MSDGRLEERHQKTKSNIFWFTRKDIIEIFNITKKYTMKSKYTIKSNTSVVSLDAKFYQSIILIKLS